MDISELLAVDVQRMVGERLLQPLVEIVKGGGIQLFEGLGEGG